MKLRTLKTITSHPLTIHRKTEALIRFFKRGIVMRLCPYPIVYPFIGNTKLLIERGMSSAELQIFTGLYDFYEMSFIIHILNSQDLFVDVGANVGVYTVLASGLRGCRSIAFEPVPGTFRHLENNIAINRIKEKALALNMGIGEKKDVLRMTRNLNSAINHVVNSNIDHPDTVEIEVDSLDNILQQENPMVLKIDVEGYETKVINGAQSILQKDSLKVIIIELNGLSNKYNFDESLIHKNLLQHGFNPFLYNPYERSLSAIDNWGKENTLYIRDLDFIQERLQLSPKFKVLHIEV